MGDRFLVQPSPFHILLHLLTSFSQPASRNFTLPFASGTFSNPPGISRAIPIAPPLSVANRPYDQAVYPYLP